MPRTVTTEPMTITPHNIPDRIRYRVECVINRDRRMPSWKQQTVTEYADSREELKERVAELKECYTRVDVGSVETLYIYY